MSDQLPLFLELACELGRDRGDVVAQGLLKRDIDYGRFWEFLRQGGLRGFAGCLLDQPEFIAVAPSQFICRLQRYRDEHDQRRRDLRHQLAVISETLCADRIDFLLLKGVAIAQRLYAKPDARQQYDLDILVRRGDVDHSVASLRRIGSRLKHGQRKVQRQKLRTEHAMTLRAMGGKIDLHWCLRNFPVCRFDDERIFATRRWLDLGDFRVSTLSDEYTLVLLLLSIADDLRENHCRIKHWVDLLLATAAFRDALDWSDFFRRRRDDGVLSLCVNVLALLQYVFPHERQLDFLHEVLSPYRKQLVISNASEARRLVAAPRGSPDRAFWFARAYPSPGWREAVWLIDRQLPHPLRLPLAAFRTLRFTWRTMLWATTPR